MSESKLSTDELATLLESKADRLREPGVDREQVVREIMRLIGDEPGVVEREYVNVDGRISFGREHAEEQGTAIFLPEGGD